MFPLSPRRDPFYREPELPPSREEVVVHQAISVYHLAGAFFLGLGIAIGPWPTVLTWNAAFRATLMPPPKSPGSHLGRMYENLSEWFIVLSTFPALCWFMGMALSIYLMTQPHKRKIGRIGLLVGLGILIVGLMRMALFLATHR